VRVGDPPSHNPTCAEGFSRGPLWRTRQTSVVPHCDMNGVSTGLRTRVAACGPWGPGPRIVLSLGIHGGRPLDTRSTNPGRQPWSARGMADADQVAGARTLVRAHFVCPDSWFSPYQLCTGRILAVTRANWPGTEVQMALSFAVPPLLQELVLREQAEMTLSVRS
jgi:hypothetical protein